IIIELREGFLIRLWNRRLKPNTFRKLKHSKPHLEPSEIKRSSRGEKSLCSCSLFLAAQVQLQFRRFKDIDKRALKTQVT
ncbi:hypothetical protein Prudu_011638, partial [Prunus dulcis]